MSEQSSAIAPQKPTSSPVVNRNSSGGCGKVSESESIRAKHVSNALAVICAQGGAVCPEDIAFQDQLQAILFEVMVRVAVLLVYHIHMSLQQQSRQMLITWCGRLLDYHIVALVDTGIQTQLGSGVCDECEIAFSL